MHNVIEIQHIVRVSIELLVTEEKFLALFADRNESRDSCQFHVCNHLHEREVDATVYILRE